MQPGRRPFGREFYQRARDLQTPGPVLFLRAEHPFQFQDVRMHLMLGADTPQFGFCFLNVAQLNPTNSPRKKMGVWRFEWRHGSRFWLGVPIQNYDEL